ncbi:glycosyl hydrolase family 61-domain-containing protein [Aspergillus multicolor]|uniref:lytic polysaccharide monooxygenase auxiliary activity family 9 protein n=1 Tax=Aspergillus multicolor TaxID=41759 RepID=UPI003CCD61C9
MRFSTLPLVSGLLPLVAGHTIMSTLYVDGENQGDGVCIRMNRNADKATFPIEPLANDAMACGYDGEIASTRTCAASQSSTLTFEFREYADGSQPGSIDISHKGPCAVYMKPVANATADNNAAGDGWFKIYEMDYDESDSKWCTEKLIDNNGFLSAQIPEGLKGGDYLVRTELLALHAAQDSPPDPQFYVGCAQVFLAGSEGGAVPEGVTIDASTYSLDTPGLTYNLYATPLELPYPSFGPAVYEPNTTTTSNAKVSGAQATQKDGLMPEGCILVRDDWCGFEVSSYSDETGCWASSKECWDQSDECWGTYLATGNSVCQIWQDKCTNIDNQCKAGNYNGPPDAGKVLTPEYKSVDGSTATFSGGVSSVDFESGSSSSNSGSAEGSVSVSSTAQAVATSPAAQTAVVDVDVDADADADASTETETAAAATETAATGFGSGKGHGRGKGKGRCKAKRSHKKRRSHHA